MSRNEREGDFHDRIKEEALRNADYKCEICGKKRGQQYEDIDKNGEKIEKIVIIEVHHRIPIKHAKVLLGGKDLSDYQRNFALSSIHNAQCLCEKCHDSMHREISAGYHNFWEFAQILLAFARTVIEPIQFQKTKDKGTRKVRPDSSLQPSIRRRV